MIILHRAKFGGGHIIAYKNNFALYGKNTNTGKYSVELRLPHIKYIRLYISTKKPKFHNINIIGALWATPMVVSTGIMFCVSLFYVLLCDFWIQSFKYYKGKDFVDKIGSIINLALAIGGMISFIVFTIKSLCGM